MHAYALEGHGPAVVVERLNRLAWSDAGESQMTTLLYVVHDPWAGRVEWVNAGHLPPLAVGPDGAASYLDGPSSVPLGVVRFPKYQVARAELPLGSTVVLYTDGLVERPGEVLDNGLARLVAAVQGERVGPGDLCDRVLAILVPTDVALLALRSPQLTDRFRLELSSNPTELAAMRAMMRCWLRQAGCGEDEIAEILTATGEAAANAIEHGGATVRGPLFEVAGKLAGGELELTVRDSGQWRRGTRADGGRGLLLMRALMGEVSVEPSPEGTTVTLRRRLGAGLAGQPVVR
jgi:anti-sigma regulatory factor (Ser/Thr protein kinase)